MKTTRRPGRINVKALVVLVVVTGLLAGGAVVGYRIRERTNLNRVLAAGTAALQKEDWPEACKQLKLYLAKCPDDEEILAKYAQANLAVRPLEARYVAAAIGAYRQLLRHHPGDEHICRQLIKLYSQVRDLGEVVHVCRQRLEADPDDAAAMLSLGAALQAQLKRDQATEILQRLLQEHPEEVKAYILLSNLAMQQASALAVDDALAWLDRCLENNPQSAHALVHRARLHRTARSDQASARADLEAASALNPDDPSARLLLAEEWMSWRDWDRAERELEALEQVDDELLDKFDIDPDSFGLMKFTAMGNLALRRGAKEAGATLADRTLRQLPADGCVPFLPLAVELYLAAERVEDARRAVEQYRAAIKSFGGADPSWSERTALLTAAVVAAEGRPYEAINLLHGVVAGNPRSAQAWRLLAGAYEQTGQTRRVREALEQYVSLQPGDGRATLALAAAYRNQDRAKVLRYAREAERALADGIEAKLLRIEAQINNLPAGPAASTLDQHLSAELASLREAYPRRGEIRILQAAIAHRQGASELAAAELQRAIEECDQKLPAALRLASLQQSMGRLDEAMQTCLAAIERHAEVAAPRIALAELQAAAGRTDQARDTLSEAVEQLSGDEKATAKYALARHLLSQDERPAAIELLKALAAERPQDLRPRLSLLVLPDVQGNPRLSQELIDEVKSIEGEDGLFWRFEQARLWLQSDDWRRHQDRIVESLDRCIEADPAWSAPAVTLGRLYEMLGQDSPAEATYRRALDADPAQLDVADRLLRLLKRQQRFAEVEAILARVPSENLSALSTHRVDVAIGLRDYDTAIRELQKRVEADSNDAASRIVLAGLLHETSGDVEAAWELLDEAQALAPEQLAVVSTRARILHGEGRDEEALELINAEVDRRGDFASYLLRAQFHAATEQFDLAERDFNHLTSFEQFAAQGYAALAAFYEQTGRQDQSLAALQAGLALDPGNDALERALAKSLLVRPGEQARRRGRALLEDLLARFPEDADLLVARAGVLLDEGGPEAASAAVAILEQVVENAPRHSVAHELLIKQAHQRGDLPGALALTTRALGYNSESLELRLWRAALESEQDNVGVARELAQSVLQADPDSVKARNLLAELALGDGDLEPARRLNDEALQLDSSNEMAQLIHARILAQQGRAEQAVQDLETYLRADQSAAGTATLLALGTLHREEGDLDSAEARLEEAVRLDPHSVNVFLERLRLLAAQNRFEEIPQAIARRGPAGPGKTRALLLGGSLLAATGQEPHLCQARTLFEEVVAREPQRTDGYLGVAQTAYGTGDIDAAEQAYRQLLELEPYHQQALNDLAWILGEDGARVQEALELADKGVARYPDDPHLLDTRGALLEASDRLSEAERDLQRCVEVAEQIPSTRAGALFRLGRVRVKLGELARARQSLNQALEIDREHGVFTPDQRDEIQRLTNAASP